MSIIFLSINSNYEILSIWTHSVHTNILCPNIHSILSNGFLLILNFKPAQEVSKLSVFGFRFVFISHTFITWIKEQNCSKCLLILPRTKIHPTHCNKCEITNLTFGTRFCKRNKHKKTIFITTYTEVLVGFEIKQLEKYLTSPHTNSSDC